jgi:hypothetical protein
MGTMRTVTRNLPPEPLPQAVDAEAKLAAREHGGHGGHGGEHFHPHAPGWAINLVLALLAVGSIAAAGLYFMGEHGGAVGHWVEQSTAAAPHVEADHHGFLGMDPHQAMYFASGIVGLLGIAIAWVLHLAGRTTAATSKADALAARLGPLPRWAQN